MERAIQEDPGLRALDMHRYRSSGRRRMVYGARMPVLRLLPVEEAEAVAWRWTLALGGLGDE